VTILTNGTLRALLLPQFAKTSRKNFPLIDLRETKEDIDIDIGKNVDNISKLVGNFQGNSGYVVQGVARKQPNDYFTLSEKKAGAARNLSDNVGNRANRMDNHVNRVDYYEKLTKEQQNYVMEFWLHAWAMLFTSKKYNETEQKQILSDITKSVFRNFSNRWSDETWERYFDDMKEVVDMVSAYMSRHPENYLPEPYSFAIAGKAILTRKTTKTDLPRPSIG
jgi:hypothetical protein